MHTCPQTKQLQFIVGKEKESVLYGNYDREIELATSGRSD